jgi:hypothetical protein
MADLTGMLQAAAGAAGEENLYIEDVFSTYLYTGTGAAQTITNGIDLDGEGGMTWIKNRSSSGYNHNLMDTERGIYKNLSSDNTNAQGNDVNGLTAFNADGFSVGTDISYNQSGQNYASWSFRKAPKFFDVVTYTGTGANRTVSHNLGSVPGCIIVKRTDTTGNWQVYHRANTANPETDFLILNTTAATADSDTRWNDTQPTDAVFSLGTEATVNASGGTYVAYLWAHDDGGFGDDGLQNVVTCGSYTGNGSATGPVVTLGYEPQWVLFKKSSGGDAWSIIDNMRGFVVDGTDPYLFPNTSSAEGTSSPSDIASPTATGFQIKTSDGQYNTNGGTYIYIAIRRGPMKTPTAGTEVFALDFGNNSATIPAFDATFPVDMAIERRPDDTTNTDIGSRLTQGRLLLTSTTDAEIDDGNLIFSSNVGWGTNYSTNKFSWMFRRAPGFFDVVCYAGTGSATTINHNLGVVPELIIAKSRSDSTAWPVYSASFATGKYAFLNDIDPESGPSSTVWNNGTPTSTVFPVGNGTLTNASGETFVAYLFATLAGVSDIGTYTGNGSSVTVTTGFQPRFILVKRTDSTGNWILGDSARGLVAGNDPAVFLNSSAAETSGQDWVDVSATGFTVNETALNANVSTATYIYLAIS